jgi:hypothetical protein
VVKIESERMARDRELKMFGGLGRAGPSSAQVSVQKTDANLGHQACVGTSVVPTGLGFISHSTQHSACGSVLG